MQKICKKYAQYAKNMQKYVITMQNMHKSMYRHILHIYALPSVPTLLTEAQARAAAAFAAVSGDIRVASVGLGTWIRGARGHGHSWLGSRHQVANLTVNCATLS